MEEWKEYRLGDLFERVTRKNTNLESENVLTISAQHGLINQEEFFNKSVAGKNLTNYYLLKKGEFAYNKSYSAGYPMGATKMLEKYDEGIVSTLYICFRSKNDLVNNDFFKYFFESSQYYDKLAKIVQEGARNHGLLNVSIEDFFNIKVKIPSKEEQEKIVRVIQKVDQIIKKIKEEQDNNQKIKKSIRNKMMSNKNNNNWKLKRIDQLGQIITGTTPATKIKSYYGNDYLWVTPADIHDREITVTERMLSEEGLKKGRIIPANSLLVTCIASIGKNAILRELGSCNQQINAIIPYSGYDVDFLYYLISYNEKKMHKYAGDGGMEILNKETFSKIQLLVPDEVEQKKISKILRLYDNKLKILEKKYEEYQILKKAILQTIIKEGIKI